MYGFTTLNCRTSNKPGQPEPLKVVALLQKEEEFRARRIHQPSTGSTPASSQPIFPFQALMTGVWNYDHQGRLIFEQKFKDVRAGSITFGRHALVIYLETTARDEYDWHGRIDIPYGILEHTIPFIENGKRGSITLTLKSPPKIYQIVGTDDLHLYTGKQPVINAGGLPTMANLTLGVSGRGRRVAKLERLCSLQRSHDKNSALCMVYKLLFPDLAKVYQAWAFIKDFTVPETHCWKTMVPHGLELTRTIETDFTELDRALSHSSLHFAEKFQVLALVLEGTVTPLKMKETISCISSISRTHGSKLTALAIRNLGRQVPTPGPDVASTDFQLATLQQMLEDNIRDAQKAEITYTSLHGKRKQQQHLALTYKATITPTGT